MSDKICITVKGCLDKKWEEWFEGLEISYKNNSTIFSGVFIDDAHLHGILNQIRDLNLKLISLESRCYQVKDNK